MNVQDPRHPWSRLVTAARNVRDDRDATAPYGFATRVAALAYSQSGNVASIMERFALRAVGLACLMALGSVALNYSALTTPAAPMGPAVAVEDFMLPVHDPVAVVLDFAE